MDETKFNDWKYDYPGDDTDTLFFGYLKNEEDMADKDIYAVKKLKFDSKKEADKIKNIQNNTLKLSKYIFKSKIIINA